MQTVKAGFLLIGPWDSRCAEIGAHIVGDLTLARPLLSQYEYDAIALPLTSILEKKFSDFYAEVKSKNPSTQFLPVVPPGFSPKQLMQLHDQYYFFRLFNSYNDPDLEKYLLAALEESNQRKQDENLVLLISEQNSKLKRLQIELENRVEKRTKYLTEARRKLFLTNSRIEGLKKALIAVHKATSLSEIEKLLNESLASIVEISWIRIFFQPQDQIFSQQVKDKLDFEQLQVALYHQHQVIGSIFFMRAPHRPFLKEESEFLNRIAEAVSLSLDRIQKLNESENLKEQWETTFNSVSDPILITNNQYDIIQSNIASIEEARNASKQPLKCYQALFGLKEPCNGCLRGKNFQIEITEQNEKNFHEVHSQSLLLEPQKPAVFVNLYHNVTEQLKMQNRILETAKMAELGTIGSSIAHELNNPLGGILSFTQLIKMDMKDTHPLYSDILEMEKGVLKCRDIVENLLGFTRDPQADQISQVNLVDACHRALKIVELQSKSMGFKIHSHFANQEPTITGHGNLISQAFKNIFQFCLEKMSENSAQKNKERGNLEIYLEESPEKYIFNLHAPTPAYKNSSVAVGLALPIATQILRDHQAHLEIFSTSTGILRVKISFSRPVLGS